MASPKHVLIALGVAGLLALPASASARSEPLTCGEQIDHDVTVTQDLNCFPSDPPMSIVKSGVTLNLGGHVLSRGFGTVLVAEDVNRVTIRNGSLATQGLALRVSGFHDRLAHLSGFGDVGGVLLHDGGFNRLVDVGLGSRGIGASQAQRLANERHDVIVKTPATSQAGLQITGSRFITVRRSSYQGISLDSASTFNSIVGNDTSTPPARNTLDIAGDNNLVARNQVRDARISGDRNLVVHNAASSGDGMTVSGTANLLLGNESDNSTADGFDITAAGNFLEGNRAFNDAGLGINAVDGTIDLGGNRSSGDGDPRECVRVSCTP